MRWMGYVLGLIVGGVTGFWLYGVWEHDLTGVGSPPPPSFDLYLPAGLFVLATAVLALAGRRG